MQELVHPLQALLDARYADAAPKIADFNTGAESVDAALAVLLQHRSARAYLQRPVEQPVLDLMMAAAQSASTSSNLQAWSVVAVRDPERKKRLAALAGGQRHIEQCPVFLIWIADLARLEAAGVRHNLPRGGLDFMELMLVGVIDATLAAQNAAVAGEAQGLGVVYIGGIRNKPEAVAEELGLPSRAFAVFGMCVGYPDPERPSDVKPRLPTSVVLHEERYDAAHNEQPVEDYAARMLSFYQAQGMKTNGDWVQHSLHRVRGAESLQGRDRLVEALKGMGFENR
ncbi:MAG: NADPH-dependent oxidoreductase [Comamonadaceae bacterium]|nr:NADPH-dependent oxidoreductase [Comamonadaceae bacterium]